MFAKPLNALIKGLRSHRGKDEARYVSRMLAEIREEVKSADMEVKAEAVLKLAYLQMLGYQVASASFHVLEAMASTKFHVKCIGYLAAALCFSEDTEVLILSTNMIKKDLHSAAPLDVLTALSGLSHVITEELAQHLAGDIAMMLTHSRARVRKRAVLVLYSAIAKYPELLEQTWERLRDLLCDPDQGVVTAAVNVVCELARRNPAPFVPLSPQLFEILTTTTNNWLLIKVVKLFGALAPVEPRLTRKLVGPITRIISTTPAMSLLYECIHTAIIGGMLQGPAGDDLAQRCVDNLSQFLQDTDQNLRYIALLAMTKVLPMHPELVAQHQDTILACIRHPDITIRLRALELACGLASRESLVPIVASLLAYVEEGEEPAVALRGAEDALRAVLLTQSGTDTHPVAVPVPSSRRTGFVVQVAESILDLGSAEEYSRVQDPIWYCDVLLRLGILLNQSISARVADQLSEIVWRFPALRPAASERLAAVACDGTVDLFAESAPTCELVRAVASVCGAYPESLNDVPHMMRILLQDNVRALSPRIIAVAIQGTMKLLAWYTAQLEDSWDEDARTGLCALLAELALQLEPLLRIEDAEVHERAQESLQLFILLRTDLDAFQFPTAYAPLRLRTDEPSSKDPWAADSTTDDTPHAAPSARPAAPRALNLLRPLYFIRTDHEAYTPPPPLPAAFDLKSWIVPPSSWVGLARVPEKPKKVRQRVPASDPEESRDPVNLIYPRRATAQR
ncbi:AP-3 complex subunit delta [Malassezia sp. CBS 17886]|nr:AP-3 complex subunit delta [Malassezia sp. CBS 17886]